MYFSADGAEPPAFLQRHIEAGTAWEDLPSITKAKATQMMGRLSGCAAYSAQLKRKGLPAGPRQSTRRAAEQFQLHPHCVGSNRVGLILQMREAIELLPLCTDWQDQDGTLARSDTSACGASSSAEVLQCRSTIEEEDVQQSELPDELALTTDSQGSLCAEVGWRVVRDETFADEVQEVSDVELHELMESALEEDAHVEEVGVSSAKDCMARSVDWLLENPQV